MSPETSLLQEASGSTISLPTFRQRLSLFTFKCHPNWVKVLKQIWALLDYMCGKRLAAILPEVIPIWKERESCS
ncbi:hypothetical protein MYX78_04360 [Acidobacteria bacterium AH-259-G07]|nr:hypothetical protein [Acidobacteria bacterium AH-259-G07]